VAATRAGFDASPFLAVLGRWRGGSSPDLGQLDTILGGYHAGLERVVAYLDALPAGA
jgi:hypothetical protein